MGRSVYEQPGTRVDGSYRSKEGSKKVKGIKKGSKRESARGKRQCILRLNVYIMIVCKCRNDCRLYICK
jgi:hypothetical protein